MSHDLVFRCFRKEKKIIRDWRKRGIIHIKSLKEIVLRGHKNDPERKKSHLGNKSDILSYIRKPTERNNSFKHP